MVFAYNQFFLKLNSNPYRQRVGLIPLIIGIGTGWIFVGLWLWVAVIAFPYNHLWAILISLSTLGFATFLSLLSYSLFQDAHREYQLELNDSEAILIVHDRLGKRKATQMMLLDDIKYAEYYPYQDSASVILHGPHAQMEGTTLPMGKRGEDVVDFLAGRGIRVLNVQFDDQLPV